MNAVNIEELFEECVKRIAAGADLEEVLAEFPVQAEKLRPMLQAVWSLQQFSAEIKPPYSAQLLSRAQFLTTAAGMESATQKRGFRFNLFHLRLAASSAILISILAAVLLLGTGFASADALPGDIFYPVKIMVEQMQINLVQDPPARLQMENVYDDRRQAEVARLTKMQRVEQVTFSGFLQKSEAGTWQVGSVDLIFPAGSPDPAAFEDAYVEIAGKSDSHVVEVQSIQLHRMEWDGVLQNFDDQSWQISGLSIRLTEDTQISGGDPKIGTTVRVVAVRPSGDQFTALSLTVQSLPATTVKESPQPSQTPSQENVEPSETGENSQPNSGPALVSPTPRPESHPTQQGTDQETGTRRKVTPVPSQKSEEGTHASRTPTSVSKPARTSTAMPDPTKTPGHDD